MIQTFGLKSQGLQASKVVWKVSRSLRCAGISSCDVLQILAVTVCFTFRCL